MSLLIHFLFAATAIFLSSNAIGSEQVVSKNKLCPDNSCEKQIKRLKRHGALYKEPGALILLATAYLTGEGVEKDPKRAYKLVKRASSSAYTDVDIIIAPAIAVNTNFS